MRTVKRILVALVLVPLVGLAQEEWLELRNQAGGKILLLSGKCSRKGAENGRMVISTTPAGPNLHGCWYVFADMVHIVWESGGTSSFETKDFEYRRER